MLYAPLLAVALCARYKIPSPLSIALTSTKISFEMSDNLRIANADAAIKELVENICEF